jgi:hypothetical protein
MGRLPTGARTSSLLRSHPVFYSEYIGRRGAGEGGGERGYFFGSWRPRHEPDHSHHLVPSLRMIVDVSRLSPYAFMDCTVTTVLTRKIYWVMQWRWVTTEDKLKNPVHLQGLEKVKAFIYCEWADSRTGSFRMCLHQISYRSDTPLCYNL